MPLPEPKSGESKEDFISRFMGDDEANKEFPDQKQRVAVAHSKWKNKGESFKMESFKSFSDFLDNHSLDLKEAVDVDKWMKAKKFKDIGFKSTFKMSVDRFLTVAGRDKWLVLNSYKNAFGETIIELTKDSGSLKITIDAIAPESKGPIIIKKATISKGFGKILKVITEETLDEASEIQIKKSIEDKMLNAFKNMEDKKLVKDGKIRDEKQAEKLAFNAITFMKFQNTEPNNPNLKTPAWKQILDKNTKLSDEEVSWLNNKSNDAKLSTIARKAFKKL